MIGAHLGRGEDAFSVLSLAYEWADRCSPPMDRKEVFRIVWDIANKEARRVEKKPAPWPVLDDAALYGLAGEIVRAIEPETEADPVAILVHLLTYFGNAIGRSPYFRVEATKHHTNIFSVFVGETGKGRKGTSEDRVKVLFQGFCESWLPRISTGLSSGEGLIWAVRDKIEKKEPVKEKGRVVDYQTVITDHGVDDKRLLVSEPEFASPLRVMRRDGNILSPLIRLAWDSSDLRIMTKNTPARATGAHISIIGHITKAELLQCLNEVEGFNGFANRFLWFCVKRSKLLPEGGKPVDLTPYTDRLTKVIEIARAVGEMHRDEEAGAHWAELYQEMSHGHPGLLGAVTSRAEAQVLRLSLIYALLDGSPIIRIEHLRAAYALWRYAEDSARYIFGDAIGDAKAEKILAIIRSYGPITRTEIHDKMDRHLSSDKLGHTLSKLKSLGKIRCERVETGGRPAERWSAV